MRRKTALAYCDLGADSSLQQEQHCSTIMHMQFVHISYSLVLSLIYSQLCTLFFLHTLRLQYRRGRLIDYGRAQHGHTTTPRKRLRGRSAVGRQGGVTNAASRSIFHYFAVGHGKITARRLSHHLATTRLLSSLLRKSGCALRLNISTEKVIFHGHSIQQHPSGYNTEGPKRVVSFSAFPCYAC